MFCNASYSATVRGSAPVTATTTVTFGAPLNQQSGAFFWVVETVGAVAGTCLCTALGSIDGISYFEIDAELTTTIDAAGLAYIPLTGPIPKYAALRLTPTIIGIFTGNVAVYLRSAATLV